MSKQKSTAAPLTEIMLSAPDKSGARPVWLVRADERNADLKALSAAHRAWLETTGWKPDAGAVALLPDADGSLGGAVLGLGSAADIAQSPLISGALPKALPEGTYRFASPAPDAGLAALGWAMGAYDFSRYRGNGASAPRKLVLPEGCDRARTLGIAGAVSMARDLINTPANDFGPAELAQAAKQLAEKHGAKFKVTVGDALLKNNFPMIHAVGRASDRAPRLIDFTWGPAKAPKITLVGKGICYDTGGLSLKPTSSMLLMKKDMGGAASVLALASMIMEAKLKVRLRVLIPAADNNVSASSFRPGDVLASRKGLHVDIGNTDAEGRLVLADALALADEEEPDTIVSMATLTGAARVALGPDLPPLYSTDDAFADDMLKSGLQVGDPLWRMPFWAPYDARLRGRTGDVSHISDGPFAGSVTAALFLKRFVSAAARYVHCDIYGWVPSAKPAFPEGGEPQGARALFETLSARFPG